MKSRYSATIIISPANAASPHPIKDRVPGFPRMSGLGGKMQ
ncbi:hypothetical protein ACTJKN_18365 [Pedobacter sp. 22163]